MQLILGKCLWLAVVCLLKFLLIFPQKKIQACSTSLFLYRNNWDLVSNLDQYRHSHGHKNILLFIWILSHATILILIEFKHTNKQKTKDSLIFFLGRGWHILNYYSIYSLLPHTSVLSMEQSHECQQLKKRVARSSNDLSVSGSSLRRRDANKFSECSLKILRFGAESLEVRHSLLMKFRYTFFLLFHCLIQAK